MRYKRVVRYITLIMFILLFAISVNGDLFKRHRGLDPNSVLDELEKDEQVKTVRKEWLIARYRNDIEAIEENKRVINNVNKIGYIVFVVAHILLLLAIAASVQEFIHASRTRKKKTDQHEIQISLEGIALRSSLHGVVLLGIAILFYFLFLKYVLPFDSSQETVIAPSEVTKTSGRERQPIDGSESGR